MSELTTKHNIIPNMSEYAVCKAIEVEEFLLKEPQTKIDTLHILHGGMYSRTIKIPAGTALVGALIKINTILVVSGDCLMYTGEESSRITGYSVFAAHAGRKQVFVAIEDTNVTMIFPSIETVVEKAEEQFTDDFARLMSRHDENESETIITGV